MSAQDYVNCIVSLDNAGQAELLTGNKKYTGKPTLTNETLQLLESQKLNQKDYGKILFDALFSDSNLMIGYRTTLNEAQGKKLRFHLEISDNAPNANELNQLNWELLYDEKAPKGADYLSRSSDIVFSRKRNVQGIPALMSNADTLKMLVVLSCPKNLGESYEELDRVKLENKFKETLNFLSGRIEYKFLEKATRTDIRDEISNGDYQAVQFYGHGFRSRTGGETGLILEKEDGTADFVDEQTCLNLFKGKELLLVVLMACYSGTMRDDGDPFSSLALGLVRQNHQTVIAMKRTIKITTADTFLKYFYKSLKTFDGVIDTAVGEAWLQLSINGDEEWSIPTLFMRLPDGRLWTERKKQGVIVTNDKKLDNGKNVIKEGIIGYFRKGKVVPIIGPGILKDILPSASELAKQLAIKYNYPNYTPQSQYNDLPRIARFVGIQRGSLYLPHEQLIEFLRVELLKRKNKSAPNWMKKSLSEIIEDIATDHFDNDEPHAILAKMKLKTYITTNWDSFMYAALSENGQEPLRMRCKWKTKDKQDYEVSSPSKPLVYHIYGFDEEPASLVLTEDDYLEFIRNISIDWKQSINENERPRIPHYVQRELGSCMLLFLGFNLRDLDFRILFRGLVERVESGDDVDPKRMAVIQLDDATCPQEIRQFIASDAKKLDIEVFDGSVQDFLIAARDAGGIE